MTFQLIDQIEQIEPGRIVAWKKVEAHAGYLKDHFPQFPILPGVLMLEALVQAAEAWIQQQGSTEASAKARWVMKQSRNVKYGQMVQPEQSLRVEVSFDADKSQQTDGLEQVLAFRGKGEVEGKAAVSGRFTMVPAATLE